MKIILFLVCIVTLLATSGCVVVGRGRHSEVFVPIVPVVVVHPAAEVIVR
jgi:hypothetical protein